MSPELKLHDPELDELDSFPFPGLEEPGGDEAGDRRRLHALEEELDEAEDLATRVEGALADLQQRLDEVKEELESVYRFPDPGDWPPSAA